MSACLIASDFEGGESPNEGRSDLYDLITSARIGDIDQVKFLLGKVDDINGCNSKGFSALHAAVYSGNKSLIQILIDDGANVNSQSKTGITPLHIAVQENLPDVVQLLILNGADKNVKDENGLSAVTLSKREQLKSVSSILTNDETSKKIKLPPLHSAAKKNDSVAAFSILTDKNRHPNVNETNQIGLTALHLAAQYGSIEVATLLIANGAHVGFCTKSGITPLHVASKWGKHKIVALLISHNANINGLTNDLLTPLHCSARSGHIRVLGLLLKANADLTLKTRSGLTPLHMAAQGDHEEVADILLLNGAPKDDLTFDQLTPLHVSAHCGSAKVAQLLLDARCLVDPRAMNGFTPLHIACRKNRIKVVKLLIKYGANINAFTESGLTPLHIATLLDHNEIVVFLLDHKADLNIKCKTGKEETPLHLASATNNVEVARELMVSGADVTIKNKVQKTPLHMACEYGNIQIVKLLLKHPPEFPSSPWLSLSPVSSLVNERANEDYTALHYACNVGREDLVDLLLQHGADVHATTKRGFNCLHLAAKCGNLPVLEKLVDRNPASLDTSGTNKLTPLHIATHYRHQHVVNYLVRCGAHLDARAKNGYTPLHIAAKRDNMDAAQVLINNGAKIDLLSKNGFSPLHLSALEGHHGMTSFLLKVGANPNLKGIDGLTPLHVAVQEDWLPLVELFLGTDSIDINAQTDNGFTPLHISSHHGFFNSSKRLLYNGASAGMKNKFGNSPLHQAVQEGREQIVEVLLDNQHVDLNSTNEQQFNPVMIAKQLGFVNIEKLLIKKGANSDVSPPLTGYKKEEPESTRKKFDDSSSTASEDFPKFREVIAQDNVTRVQESTKFRDFLDFDNLVFPDISTHSSDPRNYDAHLTYTSPQTSASFTDNSEINYSLPGTTPLSVSTPTDESLIELPFYSPSFRKVARGEVIRRDDNEEEEEETPVEIIKREGSMRTDRRRETWQGVLDNHTRDEKTNWVQYKIDSNAPTGGQENREMLRSDLPKVKVDRRSYNLPLSSTNYFNVPDINKLEKKEQQIITASSASNLPYKGFLKSFILDARGCVAVGGRHPGIRFIIPPGAVLGPTRINCQMIRGDKLPHHLVLADGEAIIARIIKMTSDANEFLRPITMEIPHFGALKSHHRELSLLKSSDGKGWIEHEAKDSNFHEYSNDLEPADKIFDSSVHCISLKDLPPYLALISRLKKDSVNIGSDGGSVTSSVCPEVKVTFPKGAVNKNTNVGLQVLRVNKEPSGHRDLSNEHQWSPVVSIEPRCRKFHRPVTITIPLPQITSPQSYRLLYSLGIKDNSNWTDITNNTSMNVSRGTATFETDVSARFCIVNSEHKTECLEKLPSLINEELQVPMLARFAVFGRRRAGRRNEVKLRVLCLTEPGEQQSLEEMQKFEELARGPLVEVIEGYPVLISLSDNLEISKHENESASSVEPVKPFITCEGTYNTRIPLLIKTETSENSIEGHVRFACGPHDLEILDKFESDEEVRRQTSFHDDCILGISVPAYQERKDFVPMTSRVDVQNYYHMRYKNAGDDEDARNKSLRLVHMSEQLGPDWLRLAHILDFDFTEVEDVKQSVDGNQEQALVFLQKWISKRNKVPKKYSRLEQGIKQICRTDILINGLYTDARHGDDDDDDEFDITRYIDNAVDGSGDDDDDRMMSMTTKKFVRHGKSKRAKSDDDETINRGRTGIAAGVKRHDDHYTRRDSHGDQNIYERLVLRDHDGDDDDYERYAKLGKFEEVEKMNDDDHDEKKETELSDLYVRNFMETNKIDQMDEEFIYKSKLKDVVDGDNVSNTEVVSVAMETTDVAEEATWVVDDYKINGDDDLEEDQSNDMPIMSGEINNAPIISDEINIKAMQDVIVENEREFQGFRTVPFSSLGEMEDSDISNEMKILEQTTQEKNLKKYDEGNYIVDMNHDLDINDNEKLQELNILEKSLINDYVPMTIVGEDDLTNTSVENKDFEETTFDPDLQAGERDDYELDHHHHHHQFTSYHLSPNHDVIPKTKELCYEIIETNDEGTVELDRIELKDLEIIEEVGEDVIDRETETCKDHFEDIPSNVFTKVYDNSSVTSQNIDHDNNIEHPNTKGSHFNVMKQEGRMESFTISSDSEGDFRDLKEEFTQKYLQGGIDVTDFEHAIDPIDRLLYCYNSTKVGNSTFYDSTNFNEDSINFNEDSINFNEDSTNFNEDSINFNEDSTNFNEDSINFNKDSTNFNEDSINFNEDSTNFNEDSINFNEDSTNFNEDSINFNEDSINFNEDSINFLTGYSSYEPSIDRFVSTQSVDDVATWQNISDLKLSDSTTRGVTLLSDIHHDSFDSDDYNTGSPLVIRESIDELPDGYVAGRHSRVNVGRFDGDQECSEKNGNVFEQIPGADNGRNDDF